MFSPRYGPRNILCLFMCVILLGILVSLNTGNIGLENICNLETIASPEYPNWKQHLYEQSSNPPIAGRLNNSVKKFLAIGISTLYRKENYLLKTLKSFVEESTEEERKSAVIIIFLADTDSAKKNIQIQMIQSNFQDHLESGFIQVIESSPDIYPGFETTKTNGEPLRRVKWRSKQAIDFAFLISFVSKLSVKYYLVMEDDIETIPQYITAIKDFIRLKQTREWVALRFSMFVGIGLLLKCEDLAKLVEFLLMFYQDLPVDMLLRKFASLMMPEGENLMRRIPSIFQHFGLKSTLPKKYQMKIDKTFDIAKRRFKNTNPPADVFTSLQIHDEFYPQYAYKTTPGFFWGIVKSKPKKPSFETFHIVFPSPTSVTRIVILSGIVSSAKRKEVQNGTIHHGYLDGGSKILKILPNGHAFCEHYEKLGKFHSGEIDVRFEDSKSFECIRIRFDERVGTNIVIREIEIF